MNVDKNDMIKVFTKGGKSITGKIDGIGRNTNNRVDILVNDNVKTSENFDKLYEIKKESISTEAFKQTSKLGQKILSLLKKGESSSEIRKWLKLLNDSNVITGKDFDAAWSALARYDENDVKGFNEKLNKLYESFKEANFNPGDTVKYLEPGMDEWMNTIFVRYDSGKAIIVDPSEEAASGRGNWRNAKTIKVNINDIKK